MLSIFTIIGSGFKWLFDPKNRWLITFVLIAAIVALIVIQFNTISNLKKELVAQKTESERVYNNLLAANDTVRNYKLKNGAMRGEITGYNITLEELKGQYKNLFTQFDKTYKEWKNQPPKTIVEYHTTIVEKLSNVPTSIIADKFGNELLSFKHDTTFSPGNSRSIKGLFPINKKYFTKKDSTLLKTDSINIFAKDYALPGSLELSQEMSLITGISTDLKTNKPIVWVETKYPGVKFSEIKGANIFDDEASKKAMRKAERKFGLGLHFGVGIMYSTGGIYFGPDLSIGINYTPNIIKW